MIEIARVGPPGFYVSPQRHFLSGVLTQGAAMQTSDRKDPHGVAMENPESSLKNSACHAG
jgi:hypothetical protein